MHWLEKSFFEVVLRPSNQRVLVEVLPNRLVLRTHAYSGYCEVKSADEMLSRGIFEHHVTGTMRQEVVDSLFSMSVVRKAAGMRWLMKYAPRYAVEALTLVWRRADSSVALPSDDDVWAASYALYKADEQDAGVDLFRDPDGAPDDVEVEEHAPCDLRIPSRETIQMLRAQMMHLDIVDLVLDDHAFGWLVQALPEADLRALSCRVRERIVFDDEIICPALDIPPGLRVLHVPGAVGGLDRYGNFKPLTIKFG